MLRPVILHVEDDPDDAFFVAYAFGNAFPGCQIQRVKDGREAIDFLKRTIESAEPGSQDNSPLVLLDLKLPDTNGFEVLQWIRTQAQLKNLQVAILSGSSIDKDKQRAFALGANAYFMKRPNHEDLIEFVAGVLKRPKSGLPLGAEGTIPEPPLADSTSEPQAPS